MMCACVYDTHLMIRFIRNSATNSNSKLLVTSTRPFSSPKMTKSSALLLLLAAALQGAAAQTVPVKWVAVG